MLWNTGGFMATSKVFTKGKRYFSEKYGWAQIVEYRDKYDVLIRFDRTGTISSVTCASLRGCSFQDLNQPTLLGVGYRGYGKYSTRSSDKNGKSSSYLYWQRMLRRCYDPKCADYKDYGAKGITVCKEWHNFQNFSEWFYSQKNHTRKGYHLDKDLTVRGNKIYCAKACNLIPAELNIMNIDKIAKKFSVSSAGNYRFSSREGGYYSSYEECKKEYTKFKRIKLGNLIIKNYEEGLIPYEVYKNLLFILNDNFPSESVDEFSLCNMDTPEDTVKDIIDLLPEVNAPEGCYHLLNKLVGKVEWDNKHYK